MNHFATVPADGHTVAVPACQSNWVTAEIWYPNAVKYNAMEFEPVANIARSPLAFWAHPSSKVNTPEDLIREIRAKNKPTNGDQATHHAQKNNVQLFIHSLGC
jgi:tripartite-type tricarboxylate transporter receptor subunit TctC